MERGQKVRRRADHVPESGLGTSDECALPLPCACLREIEIKYEFRSDAVATRGTNQRGAHP